MTESFKNYKPPLAAQLTKLQEIITSISTSKVARKVKRNTKTIRSDFIYETLEHDVEVHIHPNSCLKGSSPDYLVYDELIHTNRYLIYPEIISHNLRYFMRNVTKVSNLHWLVKYDEHLTNKIELLNEPKPFYSRKKGEMIVFASSTFGPKNWSLPCFEVLFCN